MMNNSTPNIRKAMYIAIGIICAALSVITIAIIVLMKGIADDGIELGNAIAILVVTMIAVIILIIVFLFRILNRLMKERDILISIIDSVSFPISVVDFDRKITFINKASEEMIGKKREECLHSQCADVWKTNACNTARCGVSCFEHGKKRSLFQQDEKNYIIDTDYLLDKKGNQLGYIEVLQDVTQFRNIFNGLDDCMMITDEDTDVIIFITDKMRELKEVDESCMGLPCWQAVYGRSSRCEDCMKEVVGKVNEAYITEETKESQTGEKRYYVRTDFITEWSKDLVYVQHMEDITEQKNYELQLIQARKHAEQLSHTKSDFLSRMSHEIRTPMTAIIGMTDIALASNDPNKTAYCLDKIDNAAKHLLGVINDILDMSKIEAGKFTLSPSDFLLEKMLLQVSNVIGFKVDEKGQRFIINVDRDVPDAIVTDRQRLAQVLTNLLSNAVKFSPEDTEIILHISMLDKEDEVYNLLFEVIDSGIGIDEEKALRLFNSFEQADESISRRFGGTGLGLSISKTIVELMEGEIIVESKVGEGSNFHFNIKVPKGTSEPATILSPSIDKSKVSIMLVDDDYNVQEYFSNMLKAIELNCDIASSGEEACSLAEKKEYSIIFVDWIMPGMDGIELTRKLRQSYGGNAIVIMISAYEIDKIEKEAISAGVNSFLAKPLFPAAVVECINECLSQLSGGEDKETRAAMRNHDIFAGYHILLAEDMEINREIIQEILEGTGLQIDCAENGRVAVEMFEGNQDVYDMILMDVQMPEMDGYEATRRIREIESDKTKKIPIMAMTANVFREDVENCIAAGMDDHVGKPIDREELIKKLKDYLVYASAGELYK